MPPLDDPQPGAALAAQRAPAIASARTERKMELGFETRGI
jgi:hypothetical protein